MFDSGFWFLAFGVAALAGHWLLPLGLCYLSFAHILKWCICIINYYASRYHLRIKIVVREQCVPKQKYIYK